MKTRRLSTMVTALFATALLSWGGGGAFASQGAPLTPELAAKREMVRKQQAQRVTPEKRKRAAEALKAERLKVYQAKQAQKLAPAATDQKPASQ